MVALVRYSSACSACPCERSRSRDIRHLNSMKRGGQPGRRRSCIRRRWCRSRMSSLRRRATTLRLKRRAPRTVALLRLKSFALSVGTVEIRKNHARLLHLWESMAREWGEGWPKLIIAGKRGWQADEALRALRRADNQSPYLWIEAPTDEELVWLYSRASFTVFPSLAEGWGMPIGESLWFGKPCVASNTTSMPEVGGDSLFLRRSARHGQFRCSQSRGSSATVISMRGRSP